MRHHGRGAVARTRHFGIRATFVAIALLGASCRSTDDAPPQQGRSSTPLAATADMCAASPLEKATLFFEPHGMTLVSGMIDAVKQDTPELAIIKAMQAPPDQMKKLLKDLARLVKEKVELLAKERYAFLTKGKEAQQKIFTERWGFIVECDRIHGLTKTEVANGTALGPWSKGSKTNIGLMSCALCHTGRVAGRAWEGLGNKRIDVYTVGADSVALLTPFVKLRDLIRPSNSPAAQIDTNAMAFNHRLADRDMANRTVGLVPDAHVTQWIYDETGRGQPDTPPRGEVKVPSLWNLKLRRGGCNDTDCEVGLFADGFGTGRGWIGGAVLGAGQPLEVVARPDYQAAVRQAETTLLELSGPPPYPCKVDSVLAERGKTLYYSEKGCARCHASGENEPPRVIPNSVVGADPARLELLDGGSYGAETRRRMDKITEDVPRLVRARYKDLDTDGTVVHGYIAPRLEGVWARFPYLHNGSVPTLDALLSPPEERPKQFDLTLVETRECFDPKRVGLLDSPECKPNLWNWKIPEKPDVLEDTPQLRKVYDTRRIGHHNTGHAFWRDQATGAWTLAPEDRKAIIEYVKTLGATKPDAAWCPPEL